MSNPETISLKPYPVGKPSGLPWLGNVPQHWGILRGKHIFHPIDTRSQSGNEELLTVSANRGVIPRNVANVTMFEAENYTGHKLCWPGDLVINSLWAWAQGLGISQYHGIISSAYGVYRLKPEFREYSQLIHYLVRSVPFQWELQVRSKGIWISRLQLTDEAFLDTPFPIPPPDEQSAIVRYLDDANQRIRAYVSAKERLIALLEEERQAIIQQAVTRGLNSNVRLKPSGVEWLGEVPEHWEVRPLKTLCMMKSGEGISATSIEPNGKYPVYGGNGLRGYTTDYTHDGDFALIGRQGALCGNVHIVQGRFWASEHAVVATLHPNNILKWFTGLLETMNLNQYSIAAAQPGLAVERVLNLRVPAPPVTEQTNIGELIEGQTATIDAAMGLAQHQIDLMNEYRTRLIADVVTGQLDVREAAERLPNSKDGMQQAEYQSLSSTPTIA